MNRVRLACVMALFAGSTSAHAQSVYARPVPSAKPVVSPYLNLLRAGNSAGFNYLTLVRPELEIRSSINALQKQVIQDNMTAATPGSAEGEPTTGHAFGFQTHSRYFMTLGGRSGGLGITAPRANVSSSRAR